MEIFRTDGSGRIENDERLNHLISEITRIDKDILSYITLIRDHKGTLMIKVNNNQNDVIEWVYLFFKYLWFKQNEYLIEIYYNNVCRKGDNLGEVYS
jgi:hypothetical protein